MTACEPMLFLAPMAGVTDSVFRGLCRRMGPVGLTTEMISAKALSFGDRRTRELLGYSREEMPLTVQLFGHEPDVMARAAEEAARLGFETIDLNAGCPAPKIVRNGDGSALLSRPEVAAACVRAMKAASGLPVSVKFRKGIGSQEDCAEAFAQRMEQAGAFRLTLHAKTVAQMYAPPADMDCLRRTAACVRIPLIGNGEVADAEAARKMLQLGCAGVMVGRAACGDPWVFDRIFSGLNHRPAASVSARARMEMAMEHVRGLIAQKGEYVGVREARKHLAWYMRAFRGAAFFRARINIAGSEQDMEALCAEACRAQREEDGSDA